MFNTLSVLGRIEDTFYCFVGDNKNLVALGKNDILKYKLMGYLLLGIDETLSNVISMQYNYDDNENLKSMHISDIDGVVVKIENLSDNRLNPRIVFEKNREPINLFVSDSSGGYTTSCIRIHSNDNLRYTLRNPFLVNLCTYRVNNTHFVAGFTDPSGVNLWLTGSDIRNREVSHRNLRLEFNRRRINSIEFKKWGI